MFPIKNILMWLFDTDLSCKKDAGKVEGRINLQFTKHLLETYIYYKTKCLKKTASGEERETERIYYAIASKEIHSGPSFSWSGQVTVTTLKYCSAKIFAKSILF